MIPAGAPQDAVYFVTGNDDLDDPAWGSTPLKIGPSGDVAAWLREQPDLGGLSVVTGRGTTLWASDYLEQEGK